MMTRPSPDSLILNEAIAHLRRVNASPVVAVFIEPPLDRCDGVYRVLGDPVDETTPVVL